MGTAGRWTALAGRDQRWGVALVAVPGAAYAVGILVADATPTVSLVIYAAVPVLYFVTTAFARSTAPPGSSEQGFT